MLTTSNHELNVSDLNLAENEFVRAASGLNSARCPHAGFREAEIPHIFARLIEDLPHEHRIVNRVEVGG